LTPDLLPNASKNTILKLPGLIIPNYPEDLKIRQLAIDFK
jgi:hypothetical protein